MMTALVIILTEGGLNTRWEEIRPVMRTGALLPTGAGPRTCTRSRSTTRSSAINRPIGSVQYSNFIRTTA